MSEPTDPRDVEALDWWVTTNWLREGGSKVIGPFYTKELAIINRTYIEKAEGHYNYFVDSEPSAVLPEHDARLRKQWEDEHSNCRLSMYEEAEADPELGPMLRRAQRERVEAHDRRVAAQALSDAANDVEAHRPWDGTLTRTIVKEWLRERADRIEASGTEREADK